MENNEDKQIDLKVVENKLMKIAALDFNIEERKVEEKMIGVLDQYKAEQKKIKSQKMKMKTKEEIEKDKKAENILNTLMGVGKKTSTLEFSWTRKLQQTKKVSKHQVSVMLMKNLLGGGALSRRSDRSTARRGDTLFDRFLRRRNEEKRKNLTNKMKIIKLLKENQIALNNRVKYYKTSKFVIRIPDKRIVTKNTFVFLSLNDIQYIKYLINDKTRFPLLFSPMPFQLTKISNLDRQKFENVLTNPLDINDNFNITFKTVDVLDTKIDCLPIECNTHAKILEINKKKSPNVREALLQYDLITPDDLAKYEENEIPNELVISYQHSPIDNFDVKEIEKLKEEYEKNRYEFLKVISNEDIDIKTMKRVSLKESETSFDSLLEVEENQNDNNQTNTMLNDSTIHINNDIFNNNNEINIDDLSKYLFRYSYMNSNIKKLIDFLLLEIVEVLYSKNVLTEEEHKEMQVAITSKSSNIRTNVAFLRKYINKENDHTNNMMNICKDTFSMIERVIYQIREKNEMYREDIRFGEEEISKDDKRKLYLEEQNSLLSQHILHNKTIKDYQDKLDIILTKFDEKTRFLKEKINAIPKTENDNDSIIDTNNKNYLKEKKVRSNNSKESKINIDSIKNQNVEKENTQLKSQIDSIKKAEKISQSSRFFFYINFILIMLIIAMSLYYYKATTSE